METEVREEHGLAVAAFTGDIDFNSSPHARRVLLDLVEKKGDVVVDMSSVDYIDSSGVASLIEAYQSAKTSGARFGLVAVSGAALRVLQLAHLEKVFQIYDSVADAAARAS
ncbi:MAG TPA: STAS domain-containing protein [Alphaproteobacteria bacterium]